MYFNVPPDEPQQSNPELNSERDEAVETAYTHVTQRLREGAEPSKVCWELVQSGYEPEFASAVVADVLGKPGKGKRGLRRVGSGRRHASAQDIAYSSAYADQVRQAGRTNMMIGGLVCVVGLLVTVGSLAAAHGNGGGSYMIAWGAIVFGAIQFLRGLSQSAGQG
jgi:hypothetical protein